MSGIIKKYSISINRHRTSISLEEPFYSALCEIAQARQVSLAALIGEIDARPRDSGLSSAIRIFVLAYFRQKAVNMSQQNKSTRKE